MVVCVVYGVYFFGAKKYAYEAKIQNSTQEIENNLEELYYYSGIDFDFVAFQTFMTEEN